MHNALAEFLFIAAKKILPPRGFNIAGASAPVAPAVPTPLGCNMPEVGEITK